MKKLSKFPKNFKTKYRKFLRPVPGTARQIIRELDRVRVKVQLEKSLLIKINFPPGPFLKITLFDSINGPKIVLKSVICHLDPGPDGKLFLFEKKNENSIEIQLTNNLRAVPGTGRKTLR